MKMQSYGGVHISIPHTYRSEVVDRMTEGPVSCAANVWTHFLLQLQYNPHLISAAVLFSNHYFFVVSQSRCWYLQCLCVPALSTRHYTLPLWLSIRGSMSACE